MYLETQTSFFIVNMKVFKVNMNEDECKMIVDEWLLRRSISYDLNDE